MDTKKKKRRRRRDEQREASSELAFEGKEEKNSLLSF